MTGSDFDRVLVVDDEETICTLLRMALEGEGLTVVTVADPRDALSQIRSSPYDLVITDINMPGLDGHRLVDRILAEFPDLPIVMMTARATAQTITRSHAQGIGALLVKPFEDIGEVLETVRGAIESGRIRRDIQSRAVIVRDRVSGER